jgi:hypothetical protein
VDDDLVVVAEQDAVGEAGGTAVSYVFDVMDFTSHGGLVAAAGPELVHGRIGEGRHHRDPDSAQ